MKRSISVACIYIIFLHLPNVETTVSGPGSVDNCESSTRRVISCDADGDENLCRSKGCHYCPSDVKADCIEGWACLLEAVDNNACLNFPSEVLTPSECLDRNCSWCASNPGGYNCMIDPANVIDTGAPPASPVDQCMQTALERVGCPASNVITRCWDLGCHFCQNQNAKNCFEGYACKKTATSSDDCRDNVNHDITPRECLERGCSYCKSNTDIKCVKEIPRVETTLAPTSSQSQTTSATMSTSQASSTTRSSSTKTTEIISTASTIAKTLAVATTEVTTAPPGTTATEEDAGINCPDGQTLRYRQQSCCAETADSLQAFESQWPFMGAIYENGMYKCPAALFHNRHAIISASCIQNLINQTSEITLRFSESNNSAASHNFSLLGEPVIHYEFQTGFKNYDIAVLELITTVNKTESIAFVNLPSREKVPVNTTCFLLTWNSDEMVFHEEKVSVAPFIDCATQFAFNFNAVMKSSQLLCVRLQSTESECEDEEIGALVCQRCSNCDWYLAGMGNGMSDCSHTERLSVMTKISSYEDWILSSYNLVSNGNEFYCD